MNITMGLLDNLDEMDYPDEEYPQFDNVAVDHWLRTDYNLRESAHEYLVDIRIMTEQSPDLARDMILLEKEADSYLQIEADSHPKKEVSCCAIKERNEMVEILTKENDNLKIEIKGQDEEIGEY